MTLLFRFHFALAGLTLALLASAASAQAPEARLRQARTIASLNGFVANAGQWPEEVLFFARHGGIEATLLRDALVFRPQRDAESDEPAPAPLVLWLPGTQTASVTGEGLVPTLHHFHGPAGSVSDVPGFVQVVYRGAAPGIDLVVRTDGRWFAYDLHVAAGAELGALVIELEGAAAPELREGGRVLALQTAAGLIEQRIGAAWQVDSASGERVDVPSAFRVLASGGDRPRFGFAAPGRDPTRAFVLDPSLVYATYVGGSGQELLRAMDVAPDGSVYLTARAFGDTPTTPGAHKSRSESYDAWVGKLSPDGSTLDWGTFLGGTATEDPIGVHVDQDGTAVVVGDTWSPDFPTTAGSVQPVIGGGPDKADLFISRLAADGTRLVWSTFYGGPNHDNARSSGLSTTGDVVVAGSPFLSIPPATPGAFDTEWGSSDQMLFRISVDGSTLVFQTYFSSGAIKSIAFDGSDNIYFAGRAGSSLPATPGAFQEAKTPGDSAGDAFVAKLDPTGSHLFWATYLGGTKSDGINAIAVDAAGAVYASGQSLSPDFPVTPGAFDTVGNLRSFATKLLPGGSGLVWSSFISGCCTGVSVQWDVTVDRAGNLITVGSVNEANYPTTPDAFQPNFSGGNPSGDAVLTKFDAFGETLVYSTHFGGNGNEALPYVGLDLDQRVHLGCMTSSSNLPVTPGAFDTSYAGGTDIVVAAFEIPVLPWTVLGGGLAGAKDTPNLAGGGPLTPGSQGRFSLRGAAGSAPAGLVVGLAALHLPFKGGTLVPEPLLVLHLVTHAEGHFDLHFPWPAIPAGINLHAQVWVQDPGGPNGWSASNALRMTSR